MSDQLEETLAGQLAGLQMPPGEPNWHDVRRRARRLTVRRRALRGGSVGVAIVVAIFAATPAFGLRGQIVRLFAGSEPAPAPVVKGFGGMDVGAPPGMATGVESGQARDVMESPLSTRQTAIVWVAPTKSGGFCTFVSASRDSLGGGGCDRDRTLKFAPGLMVPGVSKDGQLFPPVIMGGDTLIHGAAAVEVRFEDGSSTTTPVEWVSAPIDAGFFVYEVTKAHWAPGTRPVTLILKDAGGNELARDTEIASGVMRVEHGLVPPGAPPTRETGGR